MESMLRWQSLSATNSTVKDCQVYSRYIYPKLRCTLQMKQRLGLPDSQCLTKDDRVSLDARQAPQKKGRLCRVGVREATHTEIHDVVPADSAIVYNDVWRRSQSVTLA